MYTTLYEIFLFVLTVITVLIQLYAIFLIKFHSPKVMSEYVFFLNLFSIWDLIFTISIGLLVEPYPITPLLGSAARGLIAPFGTNVAMITASFAIGTGVCVLGSQDYCLLYRFCVVHHDRTFRDFLMHPYVKATCLTLIHLVAFGVALYFYFMLMKPEDIPAFLEKQPSNVTSTLFPDESIIMVDLTNRISKPGIFIAALGLTLSEIYCVSVAFIVLFMLKRNSAKFSKQTYRLQLQFTILLLAQFITPLFLIVVPAVYYLTFVIILGGKSKREITQLSFTCLTIYGATNALMTIIFVGAYRQYTYKKFIVPTWKRISKFLRKHLLLPRQIVVGKIYNVQVHPARLNNLQMSISVAPAGPSM